jgi:hypothetical protein
MPPGSPILNERDDRAKRVRLEKTRGNDAVTRETLLWLAGCLLIVASLLYVVWLIAG